MAVVLRTQQGQGADGLHFSGWVALWIEYRERIGEPCPICSRSSLVRQLGCHPKGIYFIDFSKGIYFIDFNVAKDVP